MNPPTSNPTTAERLKEAAMAVLQAAGGEMNIVNLNKTLFYLDLICLDEFGDTMTGSEYLALPMGPVVMGYEKRVVKALERAGWATQELKADGYGKPLRVLKPLSEFPSLPSEMLAHIVEVSAMLVKKTASGLSDFSHENPGWKLAYSRGLGGPSRKAETINMRLALQQLSDDEDDWLSAPASPEELKTLESADTDDGEVWGSGESAHP